MPDRMTPIKRLERLLRRPAPGMDHPVQLRFTHDGAALLYLQAPPGSNVRALWRIELADGAPAEPRLIAEAPGTHARDEGLTREEELARQRRRESGLGVTTYATAQRADLVTSAVAGACLVSLAGEPAAALPGWTGVQASHPAPDGSLIALVVDGDLWLVRPDGGTVERLTADAAPGRFNGLPEYAAAEELDRFDGTWWSADARSLAWAAVDERAIPETTIGVARDPASGREVPERHRYPFAGGPNAAVRLLVRDLAHGTTREAQVRIGDGYLARVHAAPAGWFLVGVLPRDQRRLRWWRVEPSGAARLLWEEQGVPWITLDDATRVLPGDRVLRATEATGFRHLELRAADGTIERRLTGGAWVVTSLVHVDEPRAQVLFEGTADGELERHLYRVPLDAPAPVARPERLTGEAGTHACVVAPDGSRWTDTWSTSTAAPRVDLVEREGPRRTLHAPSATAADLGLVLPRFEEIVAADGTTGLRAARFSPVDAAGSSGARGPTPPPAVVWVYGGPHSQYVRDHWELTAHPLRQALVDAGFAVVMADGRGTAHRGAAFAAALDGALGTVELDDQLALVNTLAERGQIDPERVGITGWSYGGYMAIRALARHPDRFRSAVAGAPVVAWDGYDTAYTERYLGLPRDNPDGYRRASLLDDARTLRRPLLLIHGTLDENVHRRHSDLLLASVGGATLPEVLLLEGQRHRIQAAATLGERDRRSVAFLCTTLGVDVPAGFDDVAGDGQAAS